MITVKNEDSTAHTLTALSSSGAKFDTGSINPNGTGHFRAPMKKGQYDYHCSIHPFMHGILKVS
jgi:plastocyanin